MASETIYVGQEINVNYLLNTNNVLPNSVSFDWSSSDDTKCVILHEDPTASVATLLALVPTDVNNPITITCTATIAIGKHVFTQADSMSVIVPNPAFTGKIIVN